MMALCLMISMSLSLIMMIASSILSKKKFTNREKMSPFECGFDPKFSARTTFSIHFFLIAILFLIFDIEITMILPFIKIDFTNMINMSMSLTLIIMIMIIGLLHEWKQGALKWKL